MIVTILLPLLVMHVGAIKTLLSLPHIHRGIQLTRVTRLPFRQAADVHLIHCQNLVLGTTLVLQQHTMMAKQSPLQIPIIHPVDQLMM